MAILTHIFFTTSQKGATIIRPFFWIKKLKHGELVIRQHMADLGFGLLKLDSMYSSVKQSVTVLLTRNEKIARRFLPLNSVSSIVIFFYHWRVIYWSHTRILMHKKQTFDLVHVRSHWVPAKNLPSNQDCKVFSFHCLWRYFLSWGWPRSIRNAALGEFLITTSVRVS